MTDQNHDMAETLSLVPDVSDMPLDLTKDEKIRATALMLGIRYYTDTIIKDAAYLSLMMQREKEEQYKNDRDPSAALWHLKPASVQGVIHCAYEFEQYLLGNRTDIVLAVNGEVVSPVQTEKP